MGKITDGSIRAFEKDLYINERSETTIKKYILAVKRLQNYLQEDEMTKENILKYRDNLETKVKAQTVNGTISAINSYLCFIGWQDCRVKLLKVQRQMFLDESRELTKNEYKRLLAAARNKNRRLYLVLMTICGTGIRVSELQYITVDAVCTGRTDIRMKGKTRTVILPKKLRKYLAEYLRETKIEDGPVFVTRSGKVMDRSNICHAMKKLCRDARVDPSKVFPHNLRHLFARSFYAIEKNLAYLADVMGHSRIETTRIYVAKSVSSHEKILNRMKLVE